MVMKFSILDYSIAEDRQRWLNAWASSSTQIPFAHPDVGHLLGPSDGWLYAALAVDGPGTVLYPFFLREIGVASAGGYDIASPYGYCGPLQWDLKDVEESARTFWSYFDDWAIANGVVSEFVRLSLFQDERLPFPGRLRTRQPNFVRTLEKYPTPLWEGREYKKARKNARHAVRAGVTIEIDRAGTCADEFRSVYLSTMDRRGGDDWYRFGTDFFDGLRDALPERMVYVCARHGGRLVSADLILLDTRTGYDFLGGTEAASFHLRPNDLVKVAACEWLQRNEYTRFVIGGGLRAGDDLERYKRTFAPQGLRPYVTGERVFAPDKYAALVRAQCGTSVGEDNAGYFPAYRRPKSNTRMPAAPAEVGSSK